MTNDVRHLTEQRDTAQRELAEIGQILAAYDYGGSYAFQVAQLAADHERLRTQVIFASLVS